jgi:hypothetical protein
MLLEDGSGLTLWGFPQDYRNAASTYETLLKVCPAVDEYKIYYAQSLYKVRLQPFDSPVIMK